MNRIVPLEAAPDYDEGKVSIIKDLAGFSPFAVAPAYPYPTGTNPLTSQTISVLMVEECPVDTRRLHSKRADLVVLEHPDRRQDPDQQRGAVLHGDRADGAGQPRALRERRTGRGVLAAPPELQRIAT